VLESRGYDGIAIRSPTDSQIAAHPDFHLVPEWVRWTMPCPASPQAWLEGLTGSDARSQMRRKLRASDSIRVQTAPLTLSDYQSWHQQLYVPEVLSKSGAIPTWPEVGGLSNKLQVSLPPVADATVVPGMLRMFMFETDGRLIGGILATHDAAGRMVRIRAAAYEAVSRARRELAIRGMQQLILLGNELGCDSLSYGDDPNLFGIDATLGLARFKASIGMRPSVSPLGQLQLLKLFPGTTQRLAEDAAEELSCGVLCFAIPQRDAKHINCALQIGADAAAPAVRVPKGIPLIRIDRSVSSLLRLAV
jgi:hypothetical protein